MKTLLIILGASVPVLAAFEFSTTDAIQSATAGSSVATREISSAFLINPAVSAFLPGSRLGLSYFQPFGISGLNFGGLVLSTRFRGFGVGCAFTSFGEDLYRESQGVVNVSRAFMKNRLALGVNIRGYSISLKEYAGMNTWGLDAGVQYQITEKVRTGFSVLNANQPVLSGRREELPLVTQWGINFDMGEAFTTYISLSKDAWFPASIRVGFHYRINSFMDLHSGFNTAPAVPSLGFSLQRSWISVQYAFQYHFELAGTHFWGISFTKP